MASDTAYAGNWAAVSAPDGDTAAMRTSSEGVDLDAALASHEEAVERAMKAVGRLASALKGWKKACQVGHMSNRQKLAASALQIVDEAEAAVRTAGDTWDFDVEAYLEGSQWREDVAATAQERYGLRVLKNEAARQLISSPVAVRAVPGRGILRIGRTSWASIRPKAVAAELKRLHDRVSDANSQEFLESLHAACARQCRDGRMFITFREAYDLFCLAPGYRRENPPQVFAETLYALHRSEVKATKSGMVLQWEGPSGVVKERDVFTVMAEDGRTLRYYGMWFR